MDAGFLSTWSSLPLSPNSLHLSLRALLLKRFLRSPPLPLALCPAVLLCSPRACVFVYVRVCVCVCVCASYAPAFHFFVPLSFNLYIIPLRFPPAFSHNVKADGPWQHDILGQSINTWSQRACSRKQVPMEQETIAQTTCQLRPACSARSFFPLVDLSHPSSVLCSFCLVPFIPGFLVALCPLHEPQRWEWIIFNA